MFKKLILITLILLILGAVAVSGESGSYVTESPAVELPVIMYHNITKKQSRLNRFTISQTELENDFIYLNKTGYKTVTVNDVINYVYDGKPLPEKPILLSFDDGDYGVYYYLYPLLKKYDYKAVVAVIGSVTDKYTADACAADNNNDAKAGSLCPNLTWNQVNEMLSSGHIELQSHSYDCHKQKNGVMGVQRFGGESDGAYKTRICADLARFQERALEMSGAAPTAFIYPFGAVSKGTRQIIQDFGFKASFSCTEGINRLSQGGHSLLFDMKRLIRPHGIPVEKILCKYRPFQATAGHVY